MKVQGLDKVVMVVRDLGQTQAALSRAFALELPEVTSPQLKASGVRVGVRIDHHLEFIEPPASTAKARDPITAAATALLADGRPSGFLGFAMRVADIDGAVTDLERKGVRIVGHWREGEVAGSGMCQVREAFLHPEDALGLNVALESWQGSPPNGLENGAIQGFDRLTLSVRDLDRACAWFRTLFGIDLPEMHSPNLEPAGVRVATSLDHHLELLQPVWPVGADANPTTQALAAVLGAEREAALYGLTLRTGDADAAGAEAEARGVRLVGRYVEAEFPALGVRGYTKVFIDPRDLMGLGLALVSWRKRA